jgi:hypothetical protein
MTPTAIMSTVTTVAVQRSGRSSLIRIRDNKMWSGYRLAILATLLTGLSGLVPASAQEGFGNYPSAAGSLNAYHPPRVQPHLNVPYDAWASVAAPHGAPSRRKQRPSISSPPSSYYQRPSSNELNPNFQLGGDN